MITSAMRILDIFRRVRDKYESELKELEASEHNMQQKYNGMKVTYQGWGVGHADHLLASTVQR